MQKVKRYWCARCQMMTTPVRPLGEVTKVKTCFRCKRRIKNEGRKIEV